MSERKPLTLEELRKMDGKPAYWLDDDSYGIISVESHGRWADVPFFRGRKNGVNFEYNIKSRRIEVYAVEQPILDRSAWEPCEYCNGKKTLYQKTRHTRLYMNTFGVASTLVTECSCCPPHVKCCMKDIPANSAFKINFCPECGRPLNKEAWEMLQKRLEGRK